MADNESAGSTSVKNKVGRPNKAVAAIREMAARENEKLKKNYEKGKAAIRQTRNPNSIQRTSINPYTKERISGFLQNLSGNESNLRKAMHFMYYRSQIMFRLVNWYASIWDLRCRKVTPPYSLKGDNNADATLDSLEKTLEVLDQFKIHENMYAPLLRAYLDDVVYALWFTDESGSFPYILNPEWCRIMGRYMAGDLVFAIDMSKYKNSNGKELIEWLGSPLKEMYDEYESTGVNYIQVPEQYSLCLKYRIDDLEHSISPFVPVLQQLAGLSDLEDIQAIADEQSIFKLVVYAIKTLSGSKTADDWQITPDIALEYFDKMVNSMLPDYIGAVPILGDGLDTLDFSKTAADTEVDRLKNAQNNILNVSGGGAVLSSNNITSTAAFNAWLQSESEFAISSLMPQITGFVNRMLSYQIPNPCRVDFFELTVLTRGEVKKNVMEANQYGISSRLALGTLLGFSEKETLANLYVENELLKLHEKMIYPLTSSFTTAGTTADGYTNEVGQGAPEKDPSELSPEGERSRNR